MAPLVRHETLLFEDSSTTGYQIRRPSRPMARPKNQIATRGLHYPRMLSNPILRDFVAIIDSDFPYDIPFIDTSLQFSNSNNVPVQSTILSIDRHHFLVMGYYDSQLPQNLNLLDVFPHLPWHGEIVIFSLGRRTRLLARPVGGRYMIRKAISLFIRSACQARMAGEDIPPQVSLQMTSTF